MLVFSTPIVMAYLALLIVLHIFAAILPNILSKVLSYVNIFLHLLMILPLIYYNFSFEEAVLLYMISLTVYTMLAFIRYKLVCRRREKNIAFFEKYKGEEKDV